MNIQPSISELPHLVEDLPPEDRAVFRRLFHISTTVGTVHPPQSMDAWITRLFGSVEAIRQQKIIKVTNLVTFEGALFNELRARRPMETKDAGDLKKTIMENVGDPFCKPLEGTPEDSFGRIKGQHSITASNIAKYDGFHGVVVFDEHDPLSFTREGVADYLETALAWGQRAQDADPRARYFFFMWNCLWKSGASILHGHAQMTMTADMHYAKVEHLRRVALDYRSQYDADYFEDLYRAHAALGLGFQSGSVRYLAHLTPIKEKELLVVSPGWDAALKEAIYNVLSYLTRRLGVQSFNLAVYMPPLGAVQEDWKGFPIFVRAVDRGDPNNKTADMGAMELYAASVIASDPFAVARALREHLGLAG